MQILRLICLSACLATAFTGCGTQASDDECSSAASHILTNVFHFSPTNKWTLLKAERKVSGGSVGRPGTQYYLIHESSQEATTEALLSLETQSKGSVVRGVAKLGADLHKRPQWWAPDKEGPGYWTRLQVYTNSTQYFWWVYLFNHGTNSVLYSYLFLNR
jgi:hypothetical protein